MKSLNNTGTPIFYSVVCSLFPKAIVFDVNFTTLQLVFVPCGGGRTPPLKTTLCILYFISFVIIGRILVYRSSVHAYARGRN